MVLAIIWGVIGFIAGAGSCWFFLVYISGVLMRHMTKEEYFKNSPDALEKLTGVKFKDDPIENGINAWKESREKEGE